ncbi:hypothetical protein GBP346_B2657 [Burkholderia pseudomallei MSHR346]|nr:hypothetical protein GBP346_B2657 [Burkholderia pseudomallei MSHR346]
MICAGHGACAGPVFRRLRAPPANSDEFKSANVSKGIICVLIAKTTRAIPGFEFALINSVRTAKNGELQRTGFTPRIAHRFSMRKNARDARARPRRGPSAGGRVRLSSGSCEPGGSRAVRPSYRQSHLA